jgi:hypothetical protein
MLVFFILIKCPVTFENHYCTTHCTFHNQRHDFLMSIPKGFHNFLTMVPVQIALDAGMNQLDSHTQSSFCKVCRVYRRKGVNLLNDRGFPVVTVSSIIDNFTFCQDAPSMFRSPTRVSICSFSEGCAPAGKQVTWSADSCGDLTGTQIASMSGRWYLTR